MKKRLLILLTLCLFSGLVYAENKKADKKIKTGTIWLDANEERINAHGGAGLIHGLNNTSNKTS